MTQNPFLAIKEIQDIYARKNFSNLQDYFQANNQLLGFNYFEKQYAQAGTDIKIAHGLDVTPQDVVVTKVVGSAVTFNFGKFDVTNISIDVAGPCIVRFFIGTYWNAQMSGLISASDSMTFFPGTSVEGTSSTSLNQVFVGSTNAVSYTMTGTEDVIFSSPTNSQGMKIILPTAASCSGKSFRFQNMSQQGYTTTIVTGGDQTYIDQPGISSWSINTYKFEVVLISDGKSFRTLGLTNDGYLAFTGGTQALTQSSARTVIANGSAALALSLPSATTLLLGTKFRIINRSTARVTMLDAGANSLYQVCQGSSVLFILIANGFNAGTWQIIWESGVVAAQMAGGAQAVTANAKITGFGGNYDPCSCFNTAAFICPNAGFVDVLINATSRGSGIGNTYTVYNNGVVAAGILSWAVAGNNFSGCTQVPVTANASLDVRCDGSITISVGEVTFAYRK